MPADNNYLTNLDDKILLMNATLLFLKMCRKYAYANGNVEAGYKTHGMELLVLQVKTLLEVNRDIFHLYGVE